MPDRERIHKIELRMSRFEIQMGQFVFQQEQSDKRLTANTEKIDKLITRMTVIAAFLSGVLFISSDTGGSLLRAAVGVLI